MSRGIALVSLALSGCAETGVIEARFESAAIRAVTREMRAFLFADDPPTCGQIDPRGLPPGDAEVRSGRKAFRSLTGDPRDEIFGELSGAPAELVTVAVEAWGPPCAEVGGSAEDPICNRLASTGDPVLRGWWCNEIDLSSRRRLDIVADLETFARIGSSLSVPVSFPVEAVPYDVANPLFVTDGLPGRDRFTVQVLDHIAETVDGVPVRFTITEGEGTLLGPQPAITAEDPLLGDGGLAAATLQAAANASARGGRIVVTAHAAGYDGSPIRFVARSIPNVRAEREVLPIARELVSLDATDTDNFPLLLDDFDADGNLDLATVSGRTDHRLVLAYGRAGGGWSLHVAEPRSGQVRSMTSAFLSPGRKSLLLALSDAPAFQNVPGLGETWVIQNPRIEAWDVSAAPSAAAFTGTPDLIATEDGAAMRKVAFSMDAADIDGDGIDELALSRCSYVYWVNAFQAAKVECTARLSDHTDSELALLVVAPGSPPSLGVAATVLSEGNDGGFRDVRLIDVDRDGSLDLIAAASSTAIGVCGRAGLPQRGFGFNDNPRFFSTITFGQGWSVASGRFNDDDFPDLLVTGALRSSSPDSGFQLLAGGPCTLDVATEPVIVGPKSGARYLAVRSADLNRDGWSDAVLLHRNQRELQLHLGGGDYGLARGPVIRLPFSGVSEMDLATQGERTIVAFAAPLENALVFVEIRPL